MGYATLVTSPEGRDAFRGHLSISRFASGDRSKTCLIEGMEELVTPSYLSKA
jgi:hypothetical protein